MFKTVALAALTLCASVTPNSAQDLPLVPTDGECVITHRWEDGSATARCGHDTWALDRDGGFIYDHGIKFFYRAPGTWYVKGEAS